MACSTCNKVEPTLPEVALRYSSPVRFYVNQHGDRFDVHTPLIESFWTPSGGWKVNVVINAQTIRVTGRSAKGVVNAVIALFKQNQQSVDLTDLWLNLNIQWLERTLQKYRRISIEELLAFATLNN